MHIACKSNFYFWPKCMKDFTSADNFLISGTLSHDSGKPCTANKHLVLALKCKFVNKFNFAKLLFWKLSLLECPGFLRRVGSWRKHSPTVNLYTWWGTDVPSPTPLSLGKIMHVLTVEVLNSEEIRKNLIHQRWYSQSNNSPTVSLYTWWGTDVPSPTPLSLGKIMHVFIQCWGYWKWGNSSTVNLFAWWESSSTLFPG
jgi:hypothetical protein